MVKHRYTTIYPSESHSSDITEIIPIRGTEPISELYIEIKSMNGGSTPIAHPVNALTKLEIVDGSKVLLSASGEELQARQIEVKKANAENIIEYRNGVMSVAAIVIPFGRWLWDSEYALAPLKHTNLQIRATLDINGGGSSASSLTMEITAAVFADGVAQPKGFLSLKEVYSYTVVASAIETIQLPYDEVIRALIVKSKYAGKEPYDQYNHLHLDEDNDKVVILDHKVSHLIKWLASRMPRFTERINVALDTSGVVTYCTPTYETECVLGGDGSTAAYGAITAKNGGAVTLKADASVNAVAFVSGLIPHGALYLPMGVLDNPDTWYDPRGVTSLRLKATAGSGAQASSTEQIVLETLYRY